MYESYELRAKETRYDVIELNFFGNSMIGDSFWKGRGEEIEECIGEH